ncbi:hypothetical protein QFZ74_001993 [Streptomyces sp. V3I7]|nr:hypothetical protein [Streptomyces sp. V3I7]
MRGAAEQAAEGAHALGTIPARAGSRIPASRNPSFRRDHPRACGEQECQPEISGVVVGPSSRVRGAGRTCCASGSPRGTIPARAGSSRRVGKRGRPGRDHPRVRGAVVAEAEQAGDGGIIPARAGSRRTRGWSCRGRRDHPRPCGEQARARANQKAREGPFPPVRGAEQSLDEQVGAQGTTPARAGAGQVAGHHRRRQGTIPARAGSSRQPNSCSARSQDHPRVCGEQSRWPSSAVWASGPSPRVRGAGRPVPSASTSGGTIPARAGSSCPRRQGAGSARDHPRAYGEQWWPGVHDLRHVGPSPRVRGAAARHRRRGRGGGTIPARAGSSRHEVRAPTSYQDHPRACGEQPGEPGDWGRSPGTSPRVQGAVLHTTRRGHLPGTIPARAGSSRCARTATVRQCQRSRNSPLPRARASRNEIRDRRQQSTSAVPLPPL